VTGSSLWILRGAKIDAQGTATNPIIFTSARASGTRRPGDWGGIIIIGNGVINRTGATILTEGAAAGQAENYAGGTDNNDNSGILRYVRIEFAGFDVSNGAGQELNSLSSYAVGRDVTIEQRLAEGQYERLPALAADLVSRRVNLIAALAPQAAFAAKAATTTIPIVFVAALDPVKAGLVASLNRPGGNVTGVTFIGSSLGVKRLELARELVPNVEVIALLTHPHSPDALEELRDLQIAAKTIGQQLVAVTATSDRDFEAAFASVVRHRAGVLLIGADPLLFQSTEQLVALAARYHIPAIYPSSENVTQGGLMSYGASIPDAWRLAGTYAGKILKGAKPAELPIVQPTKFDLGINLKTAKALGLDLPWFLQQRAAR